jgi:molybdopterin/thiamine biosynthesis adenylyltransferase
MVKEYKRIMIIGLGGIGSVLVSKIARYINYSQADISDVVLVDGDVYEDKNNERQEFAMIGNKAEIKSREMGFVYENLRFSHYGQYVTPENLHEVIQEHDIVFLCVDNHKTRNWVSAHCSTLNNVILFSGGNELTDGNVQIFIRKGGVNVTPTLTDYHPEIETPEDRSPVEMSCEELAQSEPQLFFTNLSVATLMCWAFYNVIVRKETNVSEIYFDVATMGANSVQRKPVNGI